MITHVAIKVSGIIWSLPSPNRHHHIQWILAKRKGLPDVPEVADEALLVGTLNEDHNHSDDEDDENDNSQGFLDDEGNYLNRFEALDHALANHQVIDPSNIRANRLFSEDLW